tara:strand:+ start:199 stop:624 length:426 start_codon:yes stop_codon:yes gene_type:complete
MKGILYIYLICHSKKNIKTHTYIGCVEDFKSRLKQHNGLLSGGPRITKKAAGDWEPVLLLKVNKEDNVNVKAIKSEWKQSSRGLESRIKKGFLLGSKYKLQVLIKKKYNSTIPVLNVLQDKWEQNRICMDKQTWQKLINGD